MYGSEKVKGKLDYGCIAYEWTRRLYLGILDPIVLGKVGY